jgi:hypothetical protein
MSACGVLCLLVPGPVAAQQRPLETQDPEPIAGQKIRIEMGAVFLREQSFPVSGLRGNYTNIPNIGLRFGAGGVAEFQVDHASHQYLRVTDRFAGPRDNVLEFGGDSTSGFDDLVVGAKMRILSEGAHRPSLGFHFSTRLPNASDEQGLGKDTVDFHNSILVGKTIGRVRAVLNLGLGILGDPTNATRQNDVVLYGVSAVSRVSDSFEAVWEVNGHRNARAGEVPPGTDSTAFARAGLRYLRGNVRIDGAMIWGLYEHDATIGGTFGVSWLFDGWES